jgi:hypothetical protein
LIEAGAPANGLYDFEFALSNAPSGGSQVGTTTNQTTLGVTNGLFTTTLDFGAVFTGNPAWLAISVRSNGAGSYTPLTPLQELTPVPYAIFATTASNAVQLSGILPLAQLPSGVVTNNQASATLSNVTVSGNLSLAALADTTGIIYAGGNPLLHGDGNNNFYAGPNAGSATNSGASNTGLGNASLQNNSNGTNNTAIGYQALYNNTNGFYNSATGERTLYNNTTGNDNTGSGRHALEDNTSGTDNTAVGYQALASLAGGSFNIALGSQAGGNYGANETNNILIGSPGVGDEYNTIHIGNGQTNTFIAGVINGNGAGLTNLIQAALAAPPGVVLIPAGPFTMGDTLDGESDAMPTVTVTVSAFYMDANLVTLSQWQTVYFWATAHGYEFGFPGAGGGRRISQCRRFGGMTL